jgi:hypothetical protein
MSIPQFQFPLALSQLYDQLSHYHLTANSKSFRIGLEVQRQATKEYELQICVVRVINYFHSLLERAEQQYLLLGDNIVSLFLQGHRKKLTSDIDQSVICFMRLLMENLFPRRASNYTNSQIHPEDVYDRKLYSNTFVEFLVEELMKAVRE